MKHLTGMFVVVAIVLSIAGCGNLQVPVVVTMRDSLVGAGKVAQFHNQTNVQLTVGLVFENKQKNQRKETAISIPPSGTVEVGWLEGWVLESGETVTISHPSYLSKTWNIP
jgi:hypothetical protein